MNDSMKTRVCMFVFCLLLVCAHSARASLIVNEIMYDPSAVSDAYGEWFEIFNSGAALDLQGYSIADSGASKMINESLVIGSDGYLVFGRNSDMNMNGGVSVAYTFTFSLGNTTGDTVSILDPNGIQINSVTYGPGTGFPSGTGASLCFSGLGDNSQGANWLNAKDIGITYGSGDYGTPGAPNIAAVPEPSSLFLVVSGLAGLLVTVRRRK